MFSAEKEFCRAMKALWTDEETEAVSVNCTAGYPDERWVQLACPKACVFVDDLAVSTRPSDRQASRTVAGEGDDDPTTEYRCIGEGQMVLEVRLRTEQQEKALNDLSLDFLEAFQPGFEFGSDVEPDRFEIAPQAHNPRSVRVRGPEDGPRLTERVFRIVVNGPLEESSDKYPVDEVTLTEAVDADDDPEEEETVTPEPEEEEGD